METEREQIHSMAQPASPRVQTARSQTKDQTTKEKTLLSLQKEMLLLEKKENGERDWGADIMIKYVYLSSVNDIKIH